MISESDASDFLAPLLELPFPPQGAALLRFMTVALRDGCQDRAHAHRALEMLLRSSERCPTPAAIYAAVAATHEVPEATLPARRPDGSIAWRCLLCKDTGLHSRNITLRNGDVIGACGPCECPTGLERAAAYAAREANKAK